MRRVLRAFKEQYLRCIGRRQEDHLDWRLASDAFRAVTHGSQMQSSMRQAYWKCSKGRISGCQVKCIQDQLHITYVRMSLRTWMNASSSTRNYLNQAPLLRYLPLLPQAVPPTFPSDVRESASTAPVLLPL